MAHRLIGLIGRKGSGKDTAAEALEALGFQNVKFAGALKEMLGVFLAYQGADADTIRRMIDGDLKEVETPLFGGKTPRHAMQTLGTEWGRKLIHPDIWLRASMAKAILGDSVITDVRFPNEAEAVTKAGGAVVRIIAEGRTVFEGGVGEDHPSEVLMDELPADAEIINRMAKPDEEVPAVIENFKSRFRVLVNQLVGGVR